MSSPPNRGTWSGAPFTLFANPIHQHRGGPGVEIVGRSFNAQILSLLRVRPEVARAELQNDRLLLDLKAEVRIGPLVTLIVQAGGEVEEIRRSTTSLGELFLTLMQQDPQ
jgi:hypothetical protein